MHATDESKAETAVGIMGVLAGLGMLTFVLFPFALPIVILLGASAIPLVLIAIPVALVFGILASVWLAVRAVGRRAGRRRRTGSSQATALTSPSVGSQTG